MNSDLPSYEETVSTLAPSPRVNYRLYVQYDSSFQSHKFEPVQLRTAGVVVFYTGMPALKTFIKPSAEPIDEILKKAEANNLLTIVFEGEAERELQELSKMFTSLKHWKSFSYTEKLAFNQQYSAKVIKQVMKNSDKKLTSLILNYSSFKVVRFRTHRFTGPPKGGTKYTLHVIFQKQKFMIDPPEDEYEVFFVHSLPTSCTILEQDEILEFHQKTLFTGPKAEILIMGDTLADLQNVRNVFMNLQLPNSKSSCIAHLIKVHNSCLEVEPKTADSDKFIVNFGDFTAGILPYFLYG